MAPCALTEIVAGAIDERSTSVSCFTGVQCCHLRESSSLPSALRGFDSGQPPQPSSLSSVICFVDTPP
jgi:hypothetical protein